MPMPYPLGFFALQLAFAQKIATLSYQPYQEMLLNYTAFYRILGLDWSFDPRASVWQEYVQGLRQDQADEEWTYQFYLAHLDQIPQYRTPRWGCFSFEYLAEEQAIRIHFADLDTTGYGPLATLRKEARLAELKSMFQHIKEEQPEAKIVRGGTWLYNRQEYTRLFPVEYGQSAQVAKPALQTRGLWGQFLRHNGQLNMQTADLFQQRLQQLQEADDYPQCFPYQVLLTEAPINLFYSFYGI